MISIAYSLDVLFECGRTWDLEGTCFKQIFVVYLHAIIVLRFGAFCGQGRVKDGGK